MNSLSTLDEDQKKLLQALKDDPDVVYKMIHSASRRSFYFFVQNFIHIVIQEEVVWNWHIEYICDHLQKVGEKIIHRQPFDKEYEIINVPPGSTKSTIASQLFPLWLWINDPSLTVMTLSYSQDVAVRNSMKSRDILKSELFQKCFNIRLRKDFSGKRGYGNTLGGMRLVSSIDGSVTGDHADVHIVDDPLNVKESVSDAERKSANDFMRHTLPSRKKNKETCPTIVIMQRLHEEDVTGMIQAEIPDGYNLIRLPAEVSEDVFPVELKERYVNGLLDPVRLNRKVLDSQRKVLGSYHHAGQYQQRPSPAEGGIIKRAYFKIIDEANAPNLIRNFVADTAYTKDEENDPCAFMAYSIGNGDLYIHDVMVKHLEFPEQVKYIKYFCEKNKYNNASRFEVEPKASGKDLVSTLKNDTSMNIKEFDNPTKDKQARVKDIIASVETRGVYLIRGGWNQAFIDECATFPNGAHDDQVDCLVMAANRAFKKKGLRYY